MKTRTRLPAISGLVVVAMLPLACPGQEPDWYQAEREVNNLLWISNMPIAQLVSKAGPGPAANGPAAMLKVCVLMRAGMNEPAIAALRELREVSPRLESSQVTALYYHACDHEQAWDVAQAIVELFADRVTDVTLENRLLKHWLESGRPVEQIDRWFAARPRGIDGFWIKERLRFAQTHQRGEGLVRELSEGVRQDPRDMTNAIVFLDALINARLGTQTTDLSWFDDLVKPARALDAKALAERLQQLECWRPALTYFQQALGIPLTEDEISDLGRTRQMFTGPEQLRAEVTVTSLEGMAECLVRLNKPEVAQQKMIEAAELRERHKLGPNMLLAGRVQAESGQRAMEGRVVEAEKKSENDPDYWRERAMYFRGRQAFEQEEQALRKALELTKPQPRPERASKGYSDQRSLALSEYAHFLAQRGRDKEAGTLLRREMADAPATSVSAERAVYLLAFDFDKQLSAQDEVLWNWLAGLATWNHIQQRLLWRMLENSPRDKLDQHLSRAEKLAETGTPSRAFTLGWIMNRMRFPKRSIPLLERAAHQATDEELKHSASFALLESYLDTGAWKEAEGIFPEAARQLTSSEIPQWHSRLALIAAESGFKQDALRLWRRTANVAPTVLGPLTRLAELGLRQDLVEFYQQMQKDLPGSRAPARALQLLQGKT